MRVRVKVCGLTRAEDAALVAELGADAVGLNFVTESPRCLDVGRAQAICRELPPFVARVGVVANASSADLRRLADEVQLDSFQFHGEESAEECAASPLPWYKAFRIGADFNQEQLAAYDARLHLLDAYCPDTRGGTGKLADWKVAAAVARKFPIVLAGGLGPENVVQAVEIVGPLAVDVNSAVESAVGIKDRDQLKLLFSRLARRGYR